MCNIPGAIGGGGITVCNVFAGVILLFVNACCYQEMRISYIYIIMHDTVVLYSCYSTVDSALTFVLSTCKSPFGRLIKGCLILNLI